MSKGNTFENDLLKLIFHGTTIANLADNAASGPLANLRVAAHTSDPGEAGAQNTNEASYGAYARVNVARSTAGWTISGNTVNPTAAIPWPAATSGSQTLTHWSVGTATSGAGKILYKGTITPNIAVAAGVTPRLTTATAVTED